MVFHVFMTGASGFLLALSGWAVGLMLFLPFFLLGGMGGGDVKLLAALGAWIGPGDVIWLAIYTSLAGGVLGVGIALSRNYLGTALRNIWAMLVSWFLVGPRPVASMTLADSKAPRLAYAVPNDDRDGGDTMAAMRTTMRRRFRSERGAELIEMMLVTPILLLIFAAIFDFAVMFRGWER
jgi:prepilin peptidase CpaA